MELIFLAAVGTVLRFVLVIKTVDNTPMFWLLLNSACTASRISLFHALPCPASPSEWAGAGQEIGRGHSSDS